MGKASSKSGRAARFSTSTRYDAHHNVLAKTYGGMADLRRELAESKSRVAEREELLRLLSGCTDSQRAWLLLEDYFEKLSLSRKDFGGQDWWPRILAAKNRERIEEVAMLFLRAQRSLPTELQPYANAARFAEIELAEQENRNLTLLEHWMCPPAPAHLDSPRASVRVTCEPRALTDEPCLHCLEVQISVTRPRTGEKLRTIGDLLDLQTRAAHEQELFPPADWDFIQWVTKLYTKAQASAESIQLTGMDLLRWLCRWGTRERLELNGGALSFEGQVLELVPELVGPKTAMVFQHRLSLPGGVSRPFADARFFSGDPCLALVDKTIYAVRNPPPPALLAHWAETPALPVSKLSTRIRSHLRRTQSGGATSIWDSLCTTHPAMPQFTFELVEDTVRIRLLARSERNKSLWHWNGQDWEPDAPQIIESSDKADVLEDPRLDTAVRWLQVLDCFTPEPGVWVGDANENFLGTLSNAWSSRPQTCDYLANQAFQRLFMTPKQLRPMIVVKGSGIDWFTVSTEWEQEGMRLSPADLQRLQTATSRYVKLPDAGWVELDMKALSTAHETMA
ncbi:MAG: ATP-dependent helicase, partial [Verrucomicrobia bacterium]|nr:ATP-dependent helicase [Verrucomicrobiota bacterium]